MGKKTHQVSGFLLRVCDCFGRCHRQYTFYAGKIYLRHNLSKGIDTQLVLEEVQYAEWIDVVLEYDVKVYEGAFVDWNPDHPSKPEPMLFDFTAGAAQVDYGKVSRGDQYTMWINLSDGTVIRINGLKYLDLPGPTPDSGRIMKGTIPE